MSRPPSGRAFAVSVAPWTPAMARTMARPSPGPLAWRVRSVPSRWNGRKRRSTSPGGIDFLCRIFLRKSLGIYRKALGPEHHRDVQAALGPGPYGEAGVVCAGDGRDDGQP